MSRSRSEEWSGIAINSVESSLSSSVGMDASGNSGSTGTSVIPCSCRSGASTCFVVGFGLFGSSRSSWGRGRVNGVWESE